MSITTDAASRSLGLVFLDAQRATVPATHVMVIGAGQFTSNTVNSVTSPPVSAVAISDWFLKQFKNPERPLGSLAMVLSAEPDGKASSYQGGDVPRADFASAKLAIGEWLKRINSSKDNLAILFVCSHGQSKGTRTGFLLEDFGTDPNVATAGMSEVEQFARSLKNAKPVRQVLFFDCCRDETPLDLPLDDMFGIPLIALARPADDHGETRQQWIFASTALGETATGRKGMTTTFTDSLLRSLSGSAALRRGNVWKVTPAGLLETLPTLLSFHRRTHEKPQTPNGIFADPFPICFPDSTDIADTYIALEDEQRWAGCSLRVTTNGQEIFAETARPGPERFAVAKIKESTDIEIVATDAADLEIGRAKLKPVAPFDYCFVGTQAPAVVSSRPIDGEEGSSGRAAIAVRSLGPMNLDDAAIIRLNRIDIDDDVQDRGFGMRVQRHDDIPFSVEPGSYNVQIQTPDGATFSNVIRAEADSITEVTVDKGGSEQEWLAAAVTAGLAEGPSRRPIPIDDVEPAVRGIGAAELAVLSGWPRPATAMMKETIYRQDNINQERYRGYQISAGSGTVGFSVLPWIEIRTPAHLNLCVAPLANAQTYIIVDRAQTVVTAATAILESELWTPLLGYLASRNFAAGEAIFAKYADDVRRVVKHKMSDTVGAVMGCLIAVGSGRFEHFKIEEQWLRNLANWFPGIPDGPIILARRLSSRVRSRKERQMIRTQLLEGYRRGIPVCSLSLEWLDQGLAEFGLEEDREAMAIVRRVATRVDPAKPFTTISLGTEGRIKP